jgi:hypothetical protein
MIWDWRRVEAEADLKVAPVELVIAFGMLPLVVLVH